MQYKLTKWYLYKGSYNPHNPQVANKNGGSWASLRKQDIDTFTYNLKFIYMQVWDWIMKFTTGCKMMC